MLSNAFASQGGEADDYSKGYRMAETMWCVVCEGQPQLAIPSPSPLFLVAEDIVVNLVGEGRRTGSVAVCFEQKLRRYL